MLASTDFYKQLVSNALFWTGILALAITLFNRDYSLAVFFAGVIAFNVILMVVLKLLSPRAFERAVSGPDIEKGLAKEIGFMLTPLRYPKVLDAELREFAPEFIRFDIRQNGALVFSANMARDAMRSLRDALSSTLEIRDNSPVPVLTKGNVAAASIKAKKN